MEKEIENPRLQNYENQIPKKIGCFLINCRVSAESKTRQFTLIHDNRMLVQSVHSIVSSLVDV